MKTTKSIFCILTVATILGGTLSAHATRTATAIVVVNGGQVQKVVLTDPGDGYDDKPLIEIVGGGGTGAKAEALSSDQSGVHYPVNGVYVKSGGSGYVVTPEVKFESPEQAHARTKAESEKFNMEDRKRVEAKAKADADTKAQAQALTKQEIAEKARTEMLRNGGIRIGFLIVIVLAWGVFKKVQGSKAERKKGNVSWIDATALILAVVFLVLGPTIINTARDVHELETNSRPIHRSSGNAFSGSLKSARQLIRDRAESLYGRNADVTIDSGYAGGAYTVTVSQNFHNHTFAVEVDEAAQKITAWQLTASD